MRLPLQTGTHFLQLRDVHAPSITPGSFIYYDSILGVFSGTGDQANLNSGGLVIQPTTIDAVTLTLQLLAGQTANALEIINSNGNVVFSVTANGAVTFNPESTDSNVVILGPTSSVRNRIQPSTSSVIPLILRGAISQSASLLRVESSLAATLFEVSAAGGITAKGPSSFDSYAFFNAAALAYGGFFIRGGSGNTYADWKLNGGGSYKEFTITHQASNSNALFIRGDTPYINYIGIGTVVPEGRLHIVSPDSSSFALIISGVSGQTADLLRAYAPDGNRVGFRILSDGNPVWAAAGYAATSNSAVTFKPTVNTDLTSTSWGSANTYLYAPGLVSTYIAGASAGYPQLQINTYGITLNGLQGTSALTAQVPDNGSYGTVGTDVVTIIGRTGHTGKLIRFKNASTTVGHVNADGGYQTTGISYFNGNVELTADLSTTQKIKLVGGSGGTLANFYWSSGGTSKEAIFYHVTSSTNVMFIRGDVGYEGYVGFNKVAPIARIHVASAATTEVPVILDSVASQTSDLFRTRDSNGNSSFRIKADGSPVWRYSTENALSSSLIYNPAVYNSGSTVGWGSHTNYSVTKGISHLNNLAPSNDSLPLFLAGNGAVITGVSGSVPLSVQVPNNTTYGDNKNINVISIIGKSDHTGNLAAFYRYTTAVGQIYSDTADNFVINGTANLIFTTTTGNQIKFRNPLRIDNTGGLAELVFQTDSQELAKFYQSSNSLWLEFKHTSAQFIILPKSGAIGDLIQFRSSDNISRIWVPAASDSFHISHTSLIKLETGSNTPILTLKNSSGGTQQQIVFRDSANSIVGYVKGIASTGVTLDSVTGLNSSLSVNGTDKLRVHYNGYVHLASPNAAPVDGDISNSFAAFYIDEANTLVKFRVRKSDGSYFTTSTNSAVGVAVTSVFGRTGDVVLLSSDVTTALGFTPANKAGDTFTGSVTIPTLVVGSLSGVIKATAGTISGSATTTDLTEGSNLYHTTARARGSVSASTPISYDSGTGIFSIPAATSGQNGYLSSADWTTFNGKQAALGFTPVNKAGDTMTGTLELPSIKITTGAVNGYVLTSDASGVATWQSSAITGIQDAFKTIANSAGTAQFSASGADTLRIAAGSYASVSFDAGTKKVTITGDPPVLSVFGRTGAVTLTSGDVTTALTYTPANKAGDAFTGDVTFNGVVTLGALSGVIKATAGVLSGSATTSDLSEGSNLYYTSARFNTAFAAKSTTDLAEGTNLYYTAARFNTAFAGKTTADLAEVTNLYYTDGRARNALSVVSPLSYNSSNGQFSLPLATGAQDGYLSAANWTTFNNKQAALGFTPVNKAGDVMTGTLELPDIKITTGAVNGYVLTSNASGVATWQSAASTGVQDAFKIVTDGINPITASGSDTLNLIQGSNITLSLSAPGKSVTINATVPVSSVFGRTGAVVLQSSDVTGALGFTPANKAGDTFTGTVTTPNLNVTSNLILGEFGRLTMPDTAVNGYVLTCDGAGLSSWQPASTGLTRGFVTVENSVGNAQFSAVGEDNLRFAAGSNLSVAFNSGTRQIEYSMVAVTGDIALVSGAATVNKIKGRTVEAGDGTGKVLYNAAPNQYLHAYVLSPIDGWYLDAVAANLTNEVMLRLQAACLPNTWIVPCNGNIHSIWVLSDDPRSSGTLKVHLFINNVDVSGTIGRPTLDGTNTEFNVLSTYVAVNAGDKVDLKVNTVSWAPIVANVQAGFMFRSYS